MRPPPADNPPRWRGWLIPAALLALAPKCLLCVLAYTGLATVLGLGGPELCGATPTTAAPWVWLFPVLGAAAGVVGFVACGRRHATASVAGAARCSVAR